MAFYQSLLIRRVSVVVFATWQSWHRLCVLSQVSSDCADTPSVRAADASVSPPRTNCTASCVNSGV